MPEQNPCSGPTARTRFWPKGLDMNSYSIFFRHKPVRYRLDRYFRLDRFTFDPAVTFDMKFLF